MQVVILCGGQGTRIRDVAEDIPKPMIPIGGRPILWHIMKVFAHYGFKEFILCLGYKSWVIKQYFLDYHLAASDFSLQIHSPGEIQVHPPILQEDWSLTLAETGFDAMTGCRVKRIEKYIRGDTFLLTYGDGLADVNIPELVNYHFAHGRYGTVTAVKPASRFGELSLLGSRVVRFMEKPLEARGQISGGFFVFQRAIFDLLVDDPALILEHEPLSNLSRAGELMAYQHTGFWHPMDNSRDYHYLNELWNTQAPWKVWEKPAIRLAA